MQGADLSQPQRFVMADTVTKNSKTGITANKRLLVIKKGYLFYYSNVPKNFKNEIKFLQSYQELPKCSIEILNIKKINGFQQNSNYFSIQFEARHMMEREDIRKTMTLEQFNFAPKNKKQTITWQFTCDNQFIKQKWVHTLQTLHAHYSKEKINIQKFFDNINKKEDEQIAKPIRSSLMVPWREDQIKKSSSNESLTKIRASQMSMNRSPSPSNGKKSGNSNNSEKNQPKQVNQIKLFSPPNEEQDLVETFMKIEKTKNAHEPITTNVIQEVLQIPQTPRIQQHANFDSNENIFLGSPETKKQEQSPRLMTSFTKKQSPKIAQQQNNQKLEELHQPIPQPQNHHQKMTQPQIQQLIKDTSPQVPKLAKLFSQPIPSKIQDPITRIKPHQINQSASLRKKQSIQYNLNTNSNFYQIIYFASNRQYAFDKRIEAQKKFNAFVGHFNDRAVKGMVQFVTEKANGRSSGRFNQDKIGDALAILDVGLLKYKIAYVNTQAITINGKQKIFYNQASVKSIKKQMKIYNKLLSMISNNLKVSLGVSTQKSSLQLQLSFSLSRSRATPEPSLSTSEVKSSLSSPSQFASCLLQLRVPLCTYIEYKGISAIVFDESLRGKQVQIVDKDKVSEWKQVMRVLGFNSQCFQFRSVSSQVGDLVIAYITSTTQIEQNPQKKHHNINFSSPLNTEFLKLCKKEQASTSIQSLSTYIKSINKINPQQFSCPKSEIKTLLQYCYVCKYLRKFYRAAQAQIDQFNFVNLLLKGDQNINRLFASSGFDLVWSGSGSGGGSGSGSGSGSGQKMVGGVVNGVFFQFLLYYLGIYCVVDVRKLVQFGRIRVIGAGVDAEGSEKCVVSVKIMPRVIGYSLQYLQIYDLVQKAELYLSQNNKQLATTSLEHKQQCYFENPYQTSTFPYPSTLSMLLNQAQLNYIQNDYITCIGKCKQYLQLSKLSNDPDEQHDEDNDEGRDGKNKEMGKQRGRYLMGSGCLPVYMLLVKCYSKFSKDKFVESVRNMMTCAIDNFGEYSSVVATLFQFIGLVYSGNGDYTQAQAYLRVAIKVSQKVYEGISQAKLAQLYLDLSRVLIYTGRNEQSNQYSTKAHQIIQVSGSKPQKTNLLLFTLQSHIKLPQSIEIQQKCIQQLHTLQKHFEQTTAISTSASASSSALKQYYTMMYQVGTKYEKKDLCMKSISGLWKLDSHSKIIAIQYAFRLVAGKLQCGKRGWASVLDRWTLSREKSVLVVEKGLASYSNIVDMIEEVFAEEDPELLPAILKLLPAEIIRQL